MHTYNTTILPGRRIELTVPELAEGTHVQLVVTETTGEPGRCYPPALEAEYKRLIDKKLDRTLTETEALRLKEVRDAISDIDRQVLTNDIRIQRLDEIEVKIADIRAQIETLPEAENLHHAFPT